MIRGYSFKLALLLILPLSVSLQVGSTSEPLVVDVKRTGVDKEIIYFVMPDRYRNGDSSNDNQTGFDPTSTATFHGGDLKGLTGNCQNDDGLARLKKLGFTAIWLTPLVVQQPPTYGGAGYHGYWGVDFLNVEPRLGSNEDLLALSQCAKSLDLKLILDVVTNHTGDIIWYNGRTPYIPEKYRGIKNPSWLNEISNYHNVGDMNNCWSSGSCVRDGDFYGLDDLATEKPEVYKGLGEIYGSWIKRFGFSAFRVDTAKHVDNEFFKNWSPLIKSQAESSGIKKFTIFGEVWEQNPIELIRYVRENKLETLLDFPFQRNAVEFASSSSDATILKNLFSYDDYYRTAESGPENLVTFLGNHDIGRVAFLVKAKRTNPDNELLARVKLAHSLLYLSRGIPTVYYGDEVGMMGSGSGKDQLARQDMFSTKVELWMKESRVVGGPIGASDSFEDTFSNPIAKHLMVLSKLRKNHPALANEQMQIRYSKGSIFAFSKRALNEKKEYLVILNNSSKARQVTIQTGTSGKWQDLLSKKTIISKNGIITSKLDGLSLTVLKAEEKINENAMKLGKINIKEDFISGLHRIALGVETKDLVVTEFFVRAKGESKWNSLGVDLNHPFNVFVEPSDYSGSYEVKARVVNSAGRRYEIAAVDFNVTSS